MLLLPKFSCSPTGARRSPTAAVVVWPTPNTWPGAIDHLAAAAAAADAHGSRCWPSVSSFGWLACSRGISSHCSSRGPLITSDRRERRRRRRLRRRKLPGPMDPRRARANWPAEEEPTWPREQTNIIIAQAAGADSARAATHSAFGAER